MERGGPIFTGRHAGEITRPEVGEDTSEPRLAALDVRDEVGLDAGLLRRAQHDRLVQQPEPELARDYSRYFLPSGAVTERDADRAALHAATLHRSPNSNGGRASYGSAGGRRARHGRHARLRRRRPARRRIALPRALGAARFRA